MVSCARSWLRNDAATSFLRVSAAKGWLRGEPERRRNTGVHFGVPSLSQILAQQFPDLDMCPDIGPID
jgi:hypothetical protein